MRHERLLRRLAKLARRLKREARRRLIHARCSRRAIHHARRTAVHPGHATEAGHHRKLPQHPRPLRAAARPHACAPAHHPGSKILAVSRGRDASKRAAVAPALTTLAFPRAAVAFAVAGRREANAHVRHGVCAELRRRPVVAARAVAHPSTRSRRWYSRRCVSISRVIGGTADGRVREGSDARRGSKRARRRRAR